MAARIERGWYIARSSETHYLTTEDKWKEVEIHYPENENSETVLIRFVIEQKREFPLARNMIETILTREKEK